MFRSALTTLVMMITLLLFSAAENKSTCSLQISLTDSLTNQPLAGLIRIKDEQGNLVQISELISRGMGLDPSKPQNQPINEWSVLVGKQSIQLPNKKLVIEAFSGLETEIAEVTLNLENKSVEKLSIPLTRFHNCSASGYQAGNTHLHLKNITRDECDRYLTEIPQADELKILFLSYLERHEADRNYTSNNYTKEDLKNLTRKSGVHFGNGEEHRNNLEHGNEGFGHVMFLNIKNLILPVSIGSGIMKTGTDGIPLQRGINQARRDGGTVIWCHNAYGREDIPNFFSAKVDAQNIYDGGNKGSYDDSFYRYLNAGLKVPFSTGTDWFMYDFSRVYVKMNEKMNVKNWLNALSRGNTFITNGPLLDFHVSSKEPGETVSISNNKILNIHGIAKARQDFKKIELIQNGKVIQTASSKKVNQHYEAELKLNLKPDSSCWLALRIPPRPEGKQKKQNGYPVNELGQMLFAHTGAIHIEKNNQPYVNTKVVEELFKEIDSDQKSISNDATFGSDEERARVLLVYDEGKRVLRDILNQYQIKN